MTKYTVTTELRTYWHKKILRLLKIIKPIDTFDVVMSYDHYKVGERITSGMQKIQVKILKKKKTK